VASDGYNKFIKVFNAIQVYPIHFLNFWHLGPLGPERQSARLSEIKNVG